MAIIIPFRYIRQSFDVAKFITIDQDQSTQRGAHVKLAVYDRTEQRLTIR